MKNIYFPINDGKASAILMILSKESGKNSKWIPMDLENLRGIEDVIVMSYKSSGLQNIKSVNNKINLNLNANIYLIAENIKKNLKNSLEKKYRNLKIIGFTNNYNALEKEILGEEIK